MRSLAEIALLLTVSLLLSSNSGWQSVMAKSALPPADAETGPMKEGNELLASVINTISSWKDYWCESHVTFFHDNKTTQSGCRLFYKNNQVRIEVTGGGFRNGSLIVKRKDGTVRAVGGALLGFMKMNLDPDSRVLIMQNGANVVKGDFPDIFADVKNRIAHGYKCRVTATPVQEPDMPNPVYILEISEPGDETVIFHRRIFIDPAQKQPLRIDLYREGKIVSTAYFKDLHINVGLKDELFKI